MVQNNSLQKLKTLYYVPRDSLQFSANSDISHLQTPVYPSDETCVTNINHIPGIIVYRVDTSLSLSIHMESIWRGIIQEDNFFKPYYNPAIYIKTTETQGKRSCYLSPSINECGLYW
jgi:hypothetical protein